MTRDAEIALLKEALARYTRQRWRSTSVNGGHGEPSATVWYLDSPVFSYTALGNQEPWRVAEEALAGLGARR